MEVGHSICGGWHLVEKVWGTWKKKEGKERPLYTFFLLTPLCPSSVTINQHDHERKPLICILNSLPATGGGLGGNLKLLYSKLHHATILTFNHYHSHQFIPTATIYWALTVSPAQFCMPSTILSHLIFTVMLRGCWESFTQCHRWGNENLEILSNLTNVSCLLIGKCDFPFLMFKFHS